MKGIFIPDITVEMFRNGCLEAIEALMEVGEIYDIEYDLKSAQLERKKGKWIPAFNGVYKGGAYWFACSECGRIVPEVRNGGWNFCPNCGADMREGEEE